MSLVAATPGATLTYTNDWSSWLPSGDSISSRLWTIVPDEGSMLTDTTSAIVTATGFVRGKDYRLLEQITTANGLVASRGFTVRCEKR